jgi:glycosyltransferase involved in cell wall biosynthesis
MAMGIPIITRTHVLEALGATNGIHAFACDDNIAVSEMIIKLIQDTGERERLGLAGSEFIQRHYSGHIIGSKLEQVYSSAIQKHKQLHNDR